MWSWSMGLVGYSSSASEDGSDAEIDNGRETSTRTVKRRKLDGPAPQTVPAATNTRPKRRLPSLPRSYSGISEDDPSAHGGRVRARPFVDGDYYAHVYVELAASSAVREALKEMGRAVSKELGVTVHSLLSPSEMSVEDTAEAGASELRGPEVSDLPRRTARSQKSEASGEEAPSLHISLSHPLPLRRPLNVTFASRVAQVLRDLPAFPVGLAWPPKVYNNAPVRGPRRAFLALRTTAGTRELHALLARVDGLLRREHLPMYHEDPEFHTSFAWWLDDGGVLDVERLEPHKEKVLAALRDGWRVTHICVKVAKKVTRIPLREP